MLELELIAARPVHLYGANAHAATTHIQMRLLPLRICGCLGRELDVHRPSRCQLLIHTPLIHMPYYYCCCSRSASAGAWS